MIQLTITLFAALAGQPLGPVPETETVSPEVAKFTQLDLTSAQDRVPGMIGTAAVNGPLANVLFSYQPGRLWPENVISELFYDGDHRPPVTVRLHGYLEIPHDMTLKIWHAGGGVSGDVSELRLGGIRLDIVGEDRLKNVVISVSIPSGTYDIHWTHTTTGVDRHHYLKIEDAETGELIPVFHLERFIPTVPDNDTAAKIEVNGDPSEWGVIADLEAWHPVTLSVGPAPSQLDWAGDWQAEFANGIVQTYTLSADGTVTVDAGVWEDTGNIEIGDGYLIVRFTEYRAERWTRVGDRMVVEHWFPSSHLPTQPSMLGIAEMVRTNTSE